MPASVSPDHSCPSTEYLYPLTPVPLTDIDPLVMFVTDGGSGARRAVGAVKSAVHEYAAAEEEDCSFPAESIPMIRIVCDPSVTGMETGDEDDSLPLQSPLSSLYLKYARSRSPLTLNEGVLSEENADGVVSKRIEGAVRSIVQIYVLGDDSLCHVPA